MRPLTNATQALLLALVLTPCFSQTAVQVDYMYVKPENVDAYLEIEKQWKALHEERVQKEIITGWLLFEVMFTGENDPFNYVTVTYFEDFAAMESPFPENLFEQVYSDKDMDEFMEKTNNSRDLVYSRAFHSIAELPPKKGPSNFVTLDAFYVEPGKEGVYEALEKEIWQPIHKYGQDNDQLNSWDIWYMYPNPGEKYQYVSAEGFTSLGESHNYDKIYGDLFEKVHPGKDFDSIIEKTLDARQQKETWLWRLLDYVWPEPK